MNPTEDEARAAQLARLRAKFDALTPEETAPTVAAVAALYTSVALRLARDAARGLPPGVVLLSIVATRASVAVPQSLIDDPPAFAAYLVMMGESS
jgi:hypothetical protein